MHAPEVRRGNKEQELATMTPDEAQTMLFADGMVTVATNDGALAPVSGPGGLPYAALFRDEASARSGFARDAQALAAVSGRWACDAAVQLGWGVAYQPGMEGQLVISHGQVRDLIDPPDEQEVMEAHRPWQPEVGGSITICEPDQGMAPQGMRQALYSVTASTSGMRRAWLVLAIGTRPRLIVVADVAEGFDGQSFVQRLAWASSVLRPVDLMIASQNGPLSLEAMARRTPYFSRDHAA